MAQPQPELVVDADATNITIKEGGGIPQKINISGLQDKFQALCAAAHNNNNLLKADLNNMIQQVGTFELLNANINRADSIKDGTNTNTLINLELFPDANWSLDNLKDIIHGVKDHCININMIERITFTRTKASGGNDASGNWGLGPEFRIGYDAGLGLDTLFPSPTYDYTKILIETFGKYIDPSTGGRDANMPFPNKGTKLVLNGGLFNAFGYSGNTACNLPKATNMGSDRYDYDIKLVIMDQSIINNGTIGRVNDANIQTYFGGNASKKVLLAQGNASTLLKKQVIVGKGLGDKLQVIILWIRSQIQMKASGRNGNTGISTCDEVVALLCIILQLPFFLTSTSRDRDNVKIDEVLFYNPGGKDAGVAKKRYAEEYRKVLKSYVEMIKLIRRLPSTATNRGIPVIASGGGMVVLPIPNDFYLAMITDLSGISDWIIQEYAETRLPVGASDIYGKMSQLKKLTARQIFKLNKTGTICQFVRTAKGYTCGEPTGLPAEIFNRTKLKAFMAYKGVNDDISKRTFYELFMRILTMGGAKLRGGMPVKAAGGPASTQGSSIPPFFSCEEVQEPNDPLYNDDANPEIIIDEYHIRYKQSEFVYIDPILAAIKPDDPIGMEEIKVNDEPARVAGTGAVALPIQVSPYVPTTIVAAAQTNAVAGTGAAAGTGAESLMDTSDAVSEAGSEVDAAFTPTGSQSPAAVEVSPYASQMDTGAGASSIQTPPDSLSQSTAAVQETSVREQLLSTTGSPPRGAVVQDAKVYVPVTPARGQSLPTSGSSSSTTGSVIVSPGAGAGTMETESDAGSEPGEQENDTWKKPDNSRPNGIFDANAALRIELYNMYTATELPGNWKKNDDITISFWEVLNECMEVFVYDPRYDSRSLFELIFNFQQSLYVFETLPGAMDVAGISADSGSSLTSVSQSMAMGEKEVLTDDASASEEKRPSTNAELLTKAWNEWNASTKRLQRLANAAANARDMASKKRLRTDLTESDLLEAVNSEGGSRRSTRRRKYRKTLKTTRRKKTGKQSSRKRLTKRRKNKKRRSTTRKN